jgi:hypothetical protein
MNCFVHNSAGSYSSSVARRQIVNPRAVVRSWYLPRENFSALAAPVNEDCGGVVVEDAAPATPEGPVVVGSAETSPLGLTIRVVV